jgi:hypothetical protein
MISSEKWGHPCLREGMLFAIMRQEIGCVTPLNSETRDRGLDPTQFRFVRCVVSVFPSHMEGASRTAQNPDAAETGKWTRKLLSRNSGEPVFKSIGSPAWAMMMVGGSCSRTAPSSIASTRDVASRTVRAQLPCASWLLRQSTLWGAGATIELPFVLTEAPRAADRSARPGQTIVPQGIGRNGQSVRRKTEAVSIYWLRFSAAAEPLRRNSHLTRYM